MMFGRRKKQEFPYSLHQQQSYVINQGGIAAIDDRDIDPRLFMVLAQALHAVADELADTAAAVSASPPLPTRPTDGSNLDFDEIVPG